MKISPALASNIDAVLDQLAQRPGISRVQLASVLGLTKSSISDTVRVLENLGVIEVVDNQEPETSIGRPRQALQLADSAGVSVGVQAEGDYYVGVVQNFRGETIHRSMGPLSQGGGAGAIVTQLSRAIEGLLETGASGYTLRGVGCGLPGIVDYTSGELRFSYSFGVENNIPLGAELSASLGVPVVIENDANCCAYGALRRPEVSTNDSFVYLLVDFLDEQRFTPSERAAVGVGLSFVFWGDLWRGRQSAAGEFRSFRRMPGESRQLHLPQSLEAEMRENPEVQKRVIDDIAENVAFLATMCDLETVVIAGDITAHTAHFSERLSRFHERAWMYPIPRRIEVVEDRHHEYSVADGAAILIRDVLLNRTRGPEYEAESLIEQCTR